MKKLTLIFLSFLILSNSSLNLFSYSKNKSKKEIEITVSNNTLLDEEYAALIELILDKGNIPSNCVLPKITFDNPNKLTKTIKIPSNCIPEEANEIEVLVKRNPKWLEMIQKRIDSHPTLMDYNITTDPKAIIADRTTFYFDERKGIYKEGENYEETR